MDRETFRGGDLILLDGIYGCTSCTTQVWGVSGRRLPHPACGHATWRLVRRRVDQAF